MSGVTQITFMNQRSFGTPSNLYAWGSGTSGGLGLGNTTTFTTPQQVGKFGVWTDVTAYSASASVAVKDDGSLWSWGRNNEGQLGLGNTTNYSVPKQVGTLKNWKQVSQGQGYCMAVKTDGTLWGWGLGTNCNLGNNDFATNFSSPIQIGSDTNWLQVECSNNTGLAVKTNGTLWSWGTNNSGALGRPAPPSNVASVPGQIGSDTNWASVAISASGCAGARKTNGELYVWGQGFAGRLGNGGATDASSPIQIGSGSSWSAIACSNHNLLVKNNGELWSVGFNTVGELGDGTTTNRSTIVQVGGLTNWKTPNCGSTSSFCIKTDNTLWAWGNGGSGALGVGNFTNYSSPIQVGSATWLKVSTGGSYKTLGIEL